jgi:uncharacterized membrane protein YkgB
MKILSIQLTKAPADTTELIIFINRLSLSIVFFWFGFLKVIALSPAEGLVKSLYAATISQWVGLDSFVILLGIVECLIGILWLFPQFTRLAFYLFCAQMATTFMPLFFLPRETWHGDFVLTLTGQYIIKNVVLIASALTIFMYESRKSEFQL